MMNYFNKILVGFLVLVITSCGTNSTSESQVLVTRMDSISYGYGVTMLMDLKTNISENLNTDLCLAGLQDIVVKDNPKFDAQAANGIFRDFMTFGRGQSYDVSNSNSAENLPHLLDSASYSLGILLGTTLSSGSFDLDIEIVSKAFDDVNSEGDPLLSKATADSLLSVYSMEISERQGKINLEAGKAFLEENGKKPGIITTESGLQYEVLAEGEGPTAIDENKVTILYEGSFLDGKVFDSTSDGSPITMGVTQFIPGFTEALKLMKVGTKLKAYIPSDIAYGPRGNGPTIPPNTTIIFEIELMGIE